MIALKPSTTAVVLIDLQNGVLSRKLEPMRGIFPRIARVAVSDAFAFRSA